MNNKIIIIVAGTIVTTVAYYISKLGNALTRGLNLGSFNHGALFSNE